MMSKMIVEDVSDVVCENWSSRNGIIKRRVVYWTRNQRGEPFMHTITFKCKCKEDTR